MKRRGILVFVGLILFLFFVLIIVNDFTSSYEAWDLSNITYDNKSFNVSDQDAYPSSLFFKNDGTRMFVLGNSSGSVYQYTLSSGWNLTTASYDNKSFNVSSLPVQPTALFFNSSGNKMYIAFRNNSATLYQYNLSSPWNISTASYDNVSFNASNQTTLPDGIFFKNDGTKMYIVSANFPATIFQYSLSSPWNISTASYDNISFGLSGIAFNLFFKADGSKFYHVSWGENKVLQYSLSTPWDISTASYNRSFSIQGSDLNSRGLSFKTDGTRMYTTSKIDGIIYQYSTDITNPLVTINHPSAGQILTNNNVTINISYSDNVALSECSYTISYLNGTLITNNTRHVINVCDSSVEYKILPNGSARILTAIAYDTSGNWYSATRVFHINTSTISSNGNGTSEGGSSSGGGGGGSGNSGTINPVVTQTQSVRETVPEATTKFSFNPETGINEINVDVKQNVQNVQITVSKYDAKPSEVSENEGKAYTYLEIVSNLNISIEKVVIKFQVEKPWVLENLKSRNDLALFRFNEEKGEWGELPTIFVEEDESFYYYNSEINGFSYFLIGEKIKKEFPWFWILVGVISMFIMIILWAIIKKRSNKAIK